AGYRVAVAPNIGITPYAAFQAQSFHTPAYSELSSNGLAPGGFSLNVASNTLNEDRGEIGLRFDSRTIPYENALLLWRGRVAWAHEFNGDNSANAAFRALAGSGFNVIGSSLSRDAALVSLGPELRLANNWTFHAKFDGDFGNNGRVYGGTGSVRYT